MDAMVGGLLVMQPDAAAAQIFPHIRIVMGIVLGLGVTRLLTGTARFVQHPQRRRASWVHLGWVLFMLISLTHFWWWEFWLYGIAVWTYEAYLFLIVYTVLLYFLCALLYPDDIDEYDGYEDYFISRRKWFFGLLALTFLFDLADTLLKGYPHFERYGLEYAVRTPVAVALCVAAMFVASRTLHGAFVIVSLIYQASWILRLFRTLT
ncbi:MAG: hypothetical protein AB7S71_12495 [Dongiaceae bacterium]